MQQATACSLPHAGAQSDVLKGGWLKVEPDEAFDVDDGGDQKVLDLDSEQTAIADAAASVPAASCLGFSM